MAHVAPLSTSTPRKTLAPAVYFARCYQMIQLGTQEEEYLGKKKSVPKIWIGWEFPTEMDIFYEDKGEQPYTMGKEYSFYMNDKANFRKDLESWRNKKFTEEQAAIFDAGKLLGAVCQISVQEYTKKNGDISVKIGAIMPVPNGTIVPPPINKVEDLYFGEGFDYTLFENLPKFLKERIEKSPEYQAMRQPRFQPSEFNQEPIGEEEPLPF